MKRWKDRGRGVGGGGVVRLEGDKRIRKMKLWKDGVRMRKGGRQGERKIYGDGRTEEVRDGKNQQYKITLT